MRSGKGFCGNYALKKKGILLYNEEKLFIYFIPINIFSFKNSIIMKNNAYGSKSAFSLFCRNLARNFVALFESGNKREFQRLKDFITS
jgi:hypothetical protein